MSHGADGGCIFPPQVDDRHRFAAPHAMEVVPDVGHFPHIEAPEAIAERIAAWAEQRITRPLRRDHRDAPRGALAWRSCGRWEGRISAR
ncbi:alpha/beta fold hydrolase [Streptomyces caniscabiei]|uniref:alpha/beta fold hydrolase n=1 Tax=Streptomyces caniscabiei TaxID=2746961 RepID=UPI0029B74E31|nr:alpha/beta hydrolase [Streptomyces caniscabiei]MDX3725985.1 alpha/beta hydrolase [Streptomyces caniscabiei]